jgi:hypothetical protein
VFGLILIFEHLTLIKQRQIEVEFACLHDYENCWPIWCIIKSKLKSTSEIARRQSGAGRQSRNRVGPDCPVHAMAPHLTVTCRVGFAKPRGTMSKLSYTFMPCAPCLFNIYCTSVFRLKRRKSPAIRKVHTL